MFRMMKPSFSVMTMLACLFFASSVFAEDTATEEAVALKKSLEAKAEALIYAPAGVFDVEIVDGEVIRLKIKGEADVPTSMRGSRADRFAREKANRDARASFTKFLGENVVFSESEGEGVVIHEKDGQESSDVMSASARLYSSNSAAMLKGLIVLLDRVEGEDDRRSCTVVLGWSKKLVDASDSARAEMSGAKKVDVPQINPTPVPETVKKAAGNVETVTRVGNLDNF